MANVVKTLLLSPVPLFAVAMACGVSFYAGGVLNSTKPNGKYVTAEKNALILQAVFDRQGATPEQLKQEISDPIRLVLKKYIDQGYVVIDTAKDESGNMAVAAIPPGTLDVTEELAAALKKQKVNP